ncbi:MAG: UDP-N-acetylmuramoyl-L-alanyl-D-glutamate--2,6-diaminopimelate ligase [Planctomycetes bacterium]|nr:UDP-N-acetylmuramoyl-L-alanyl-D-glutamate--2,6-diaminopimelate ligase [Planctomycetota bacterium]
MKLTELGGNWLKLSPRFKNIEAQGITADSRNVKPGYLYVAVSGDRVDGHAFIPDAVRAGAIAVIGERKPTHWSSRQVPFIPVSNARSALGRLCAAFYRHPSRSVAVTGITGTKGKTTTSWILFSIFQATGRRSGLFGTVLIRIGVEILPAANTTPSAIEMERHLRTLSDRGGTHAVMEVSSHGIQQERIAGIEFRCGVFTNISPEHLDYHGTFENYKNTKIRFFENLSPEAAAVLPRGDEVAREIAERTQADVHWFGPAMEDGVEKVQCAGEAISLTWKGLPLQSTLWGEHNLLNLLAAVTAAEVQGIERAAIVRGVEQAVPPPGRLEEVTNPLGFRIFVDYAHTDSALLTVLRGLRPITPGRIITVFGCGGNRDRLKRPRMGQVAEQHSDKVIITSDNPRNENPGAILEEIAAGMESPYLVAMVPDRREAISLGLKMAKPGDTVLIAGKGHETYQEVRGEKVPFDDRKVAEQAIREIIKAAEEAARSEEEK